MHAVPLVNIRMMLTQSAKMKQTTASTNTATALTLPSQSTNAKEKKSLQDAASHAKKLKTKEVIELMAKPDVLIATLNANLLSNNTPAQLKNSIPQAVLKS